MATTINSDKSETKVGTSETKIFTSTRTTYSADTNGKIDPKSVKHELIYYDAPLSPGIVAATSTGTSNDWTFANKPLSNNPYLGADAQKSLKEGALKNTTQQQIKTAATKAKVSEEQQKALSTKQVLRLESFFLFLLKFKETKCLIQSQSTQAWSRSRNLNRQVCVKRTV